MHGVSAYGLLVLTGRRSNISLRKLAIAAVAAISLVAVADFEGFARAEASRGVTANSVSSTPTSSDAAPVASLPDLPWAADESRFGTRPDAAH